MRRYPSFDKDTYKGRINIALDSLKKMYPTKQIVLLTPIHRAGFYANDKNWQCTEDYMNRCGEYLDSYVDAVKRLAISGLCLLLTLMLLAVCILCRMAMHNISIRLIPTVCILTIWDTSVWQRL